MSAIEPLTEPYYEIFALDDEHPEGRCGFICSACRRPLDDGPCPRHAPRDVPGLALVECEATPRHWAWTLASDANGYGNPCYRCQLEQQYRAAQQTEADRWARWYHRWRTWALTGWTVAQAYRLGVVSGYGSSLTDRGWRIHSLGFSMRHARPYILGLPRENWGCLLLRRHRRIDVGGMCGICSPWPCCGSIRVKHVAGCQEDA